MLVVWMTLYSFCTLHFVSCKFDYTGYRLLHVTPPTPEARDIVDIFADESNLKLDVWNDFLDESGTMEVLVPPESLEEFVSFMASLNVRYVTQETDVQGLIDREAASFRHHDVQRRWVAAPSRLAPRNSHVWHEMINTFSRHQEINSWLELVSEMFPHLVSTETIGYSYEGRPMMVAKVGVAPPEGSTKPGIWIDGGIHAREWVTPATAIHIIYVLITQHGVNSNVTSLLETYDWFVLPVVNPDGYEYSHTYNRYWRKSLTPTSDPSCYGVDLNRNFNFEWKNITTECSGGYPGPNPESEPETKAVSRFILRHQGSLVAYFSFHACIEMWLYPWGYTDDTPQDIIDLENKAKVAVDAVQRRYGKTFQYGTPSGILYRVTGSSMDWARGKAGIKYAYTIEQRKRENCFILPESELPLATDETWAGVEAVALEIAKELT